MDICFSNNATNTNTQHDKLRYDKRILAKEHDQFMSTMTPEQKAIYDRIMARVIENKPGVFFLYGYGGTGKTFLWRALSSAICSEREIVLTVSSSGIATLLIPGGRIAHSRFGIPITIDQCSTCEIHPKSHLAELIANTKLIV